MEGNGSGVGVQEIMKKEDVKPRINQFLEEVSSAAKLNNGLVPESGEGREPGFNSEMQGYAMRLALAGDNHELFNTLHQGLSVLGKTEDGLIRARLNPDKTVDTGNTTWDDGTQDIALALIEAGKKWGDTQLLEEGTTLAENFLQHRVIGMRDQTLVIPIDESQEASVGVRLVNLSLINLRLYLQMEHLSENGPKWKQLATDSLVLVNKLTRMYQLPPDQVMTVDGKMVKNSDFLAIVEDRRPDLMPLATRKVGEREVSGFDAIRIPWRLTDIDDLGDYAFRLEAYSLARRIYEAENQNGGIKTRYYSDGTPHPEGIAAAVAVAPVMGVLRATKGEQAALDEVDKAMTEKDRQVMYWKLWRGLGYTQLDNDRHKFELPKSTEEMVLNRSADHYFPGDRISRITQHLQSSSQPEEDLRNLMSSFPAELQAGQMHRLEKLLENKDLKSLGAEGIADVVRKWVTDIGFLRAYEVGERIKFTENPSFNQLNEILSYHTSSSESGQVAFIHIAPAMTMSPPEVATNIHRGLVDLARIISDEQGPEDVQKVMIISPLVHNQPASIESLGFTVVEDIDKQALEGKFADEAGTIGQAHMTREEFLNRYKPSS